MTTDGFTIQIHVAGHNDKKATSYDKMFHAWDNSIGWSKE